ncbi:MAG TPA: hypothetical protein VGG33_20505, partial [Polyangia bacterium]
GYATHRETITLSSDLTRDVVLGPPAPVRGVVLTSGGQPAAQAEIEGALIPLTGGKAIIARAASDARGHFTLGGLGPGALVVTARKNADVAVHAPIVLGPAGVDGVTLTLARGGRILGVITHTDDSTGPLTRLNLTTPLLNGAHFTMDTVVSAQRGTFDIVGIPLGLIRLRAGPLRGPIDENATEVTVTLTAEKPEMKVTLAAP